MTALANSPVCRIGAPGRPGGLVRPVHHDPVIKHVENIPLAVFLNCYPIAWPAALVMAYLMQRKEPW